MTLTEYLVDYASDETKEVGFKMIEEQLKKVPNEKARGIAADNIEAIKNSNRRDFRF
jgi:2-iminoacetate synthase